MADNPEVGGSRLGLLVMFVIGMVKTGFDLVNISLSGLSVRSRTPPGPVHSSPSQA
ncbi:hypothetical protein LY78DRAFT_658025 [Colletotrichum sublineola]|nr:hypothetical protein LY78DRAFT_658025 [Colletotrichum sublineola]